MPLGTPDRPDVLVLGADGFIGRRLVGGLAGLGWSVRGTVFLRPPAGEDEFALDVTRPEDFRRLSDAMASRGFGTGAAGLAVVNATGILDQNAPVRLMRRVHVDGMARIVAWCRRIGAVHLVQLSSVSVYGYGTLGTGRDERTRRRTGRLLSPLPYGMTKARAEALLEASGLPWSAPRLPAVFGPGDSFLTPSLARFVRDTGGRAPMAGAGTKPVSLIAVSDVPSLIAALLESGPIRSALNAATAHPAWTEILAAYADAWGVPFAPAKASLGRALAAMKDRPAQMMASYAAWGAEFPDHALRERLGWEPAADWRREVAAAAAHFPVAGGRGPAGP